MKKNSINIIFAFVLAFCLPLFMVSCEDSNNSEPEPKPFAISSSQIEGDFKVGTPMETTNVFVVSYTGGSGAVTVRANAENGISVTEREVNLINGTLRLELTGTPTAAGTHPLVLEIVAAGTTHTANATFYVTKNEEEDEEECDEEDEPKEGAVVLTFDHPTDFALGNARMIHFTVEPATATITVPNNHPNLWAQVRVDSSTGRGVLTLTPRTNFTGDATTIVEVYAAYDGLDAATEIFNLTAVERVVRGRKGVAMGMNVARGNIADNLYNLRVHWFWTWGVGLSDAQLAMIPEGVEHVPTFWHPRYMTRANIARINYLHERGIVRYVRGFNEPDLRDQANMTVEEALRQWEILSNELHPGIRLISPAESWPRLGANAWMVRFMNGVEERGLRIDYIAVHFYAEGLWPNQAPGHVRNVYNRWGRRVWLMETGVRYMPAGSVHANNNFTQAQIVQYMRDLLPQLEAMPELHSYSWFEPAPTHARLYRGRLIECPVVGTYDPLTRCDTGVLSTVGQFYSDWMPNLNIRRR